MIHVFLTINISFSDLVHNVHTKICVHNYLAMSYRPGHSVYLLGCLIFVYQLPIDSLFIYMPVLYLK